MPDFTATPETTSVFILAAGRGERMRPLTDHTPKPLLKVQGKSLIEHHLCKLANQGFKDVTINVAHLGQKIIDHIGNGQRFKLNIHYSDESQHGLLETAGGIKKALDLIKYPQFICLNADIWTDFDYCSLLKKASEKLSPEKFTACIVLVENPEHNKKGDFNFNPQTSMVSRLNTKYTKQSVTFSGIGLYQKNSFSQLAVKKQALGPLLRDWADQQKLHGILHHGEWQDIGTAERLNSLNQSLSNSP